ncbi:hypothetical protein GO009_17150 [Muricauda sp. TY007]|uniref:hypothetical protein n=1 Tax=Allomuricauda sp. TY007 TaxID=2683200 RepID=UPI0013C2816C|nr:hypothetical protein [Muricauda sp. TY007]NDV17746.1 hypothetical protein [Muricauda sp. TY007]
MDGITLVEVKEDSLGNKINYVSCIVSTIKYRFKNGFIYIQPRMDVEERYEIKSIRKYADSLVIKTYPVKGGSATYYIKLKKVDELYWKEESYNEVNFFTDSLNSIELPVVEQPCIECFNKEECDEMKKNGEW